jgi:hypothetical protein
VKANQLTSLAAPTTNGTCCATTINVGPTIASGQPTELRADGISYPYANKTVPIGNITACAADAANPGKRTNADRYGEELYTFKLSVLPATCDGIVRLNVTSDQARPRTHALGSCLRARVRHMSLAHISRNVPLMYPSRSAREYPPCPRLTAGVLQGRNAAWGMNLSFECCTTCPTESALETVDLSDNRLGGRAPNWLAEMVKGTIKTLNLRGNLLTGDYKASTTSQPASSARTRPPSLWTSGSSSARAATTARSISSSTSARAS